MATKHKEVIVKINGTDFHLHNFVGKNFAWFEDLYFPVNKETGERSNKYSVQWDPKTTWSLIRMEMIAEGLNGDNSELIHKHKK